MVLAGSAAKAPSCAVAFLVATDGCAVARGGKAFESQAATMQAFAMTRSAKGKEACMGGGRVALSEDGLWAGHEVTERAVHQAWHNPLTPKGERRQRTRAHPAIRPGTAVTLDQLGAASGREPRWKATRCQPLGETAR